MKYLCRISFDLNDVPGPTDLEVTDDKSIYQAVRTIVCTMLIRQGLNLASPIFIDITPSKVTADMAVTSLTEPPRTFIEDT